MHSSSLICLLRSHADPSWQLVVTRLRIAPQSPWSDKSQTSHVRRCAQLLCVWQQVTEVGATAIGSPEQNSSSSASEPQITSCSAVQQKQAAFVPKTAGSSESSVSVNDDLHPQAAQDLQNNVNRPHAAAGDADNTPLKEAGTVTMTGDSSRAPLAFSGQRSLCPLCKQQPSTVLGLPCQHIISCKECFSGPTAVEITHCSRCGDELMSGYVMDYQTQPPSVLSSAVCGSVSQRARPAIALEHPPSKRRYQSVPDAVVLLDPRLQDWIQQGDTDLPASRLGTVLIGMRELMDLRYRLGTSV